MKFSLSTCITITILKWERGVPEFSFFPLSRKSRSRLFWQSVSFFSDRFLRTLVVKMIYGPCIIVELLAHLHFPDEKLWSTVRKFFFAEMTSDFTLPTFFMSCFFFFFYFCGYMFLSLGKWNIFVNLLENFFVEGR